MFSIEINNNLLEIINLQSKNLIINDTRFKEVELKDLCDFQEGYVNPS